LDFDKIKVIGDNEEKDIIVQDDQISFRDKSGGETERKRTE
jgi:hypothetical protein